MSAKKGFSATHAAPPGGGGIHAFDLRFAAVAQAVTPVELRAVDREVEQLKLLFTSNTFPGTRSSPVPLEADTPRDYSGYLG
jgi:hypothetical protein